NVFSLHCCVPVFNKHLKQRCFPVGKLSGVSINSYFVTIRNKFITTDFDLVAGGVSRCLREAQKVVDPHDEFLHTERLPDVVITSDFEAFDQVLCLHFCSDENYRCVRGDCSYFTRNSIAIDTGKHDIEYTDVRRECFESGERLGTVCNHVHSKISALQTLLYDSTQ